MSWSKKNSSYQGNSPNFVQPVTFYFLNKSLTDISRKCILPNMVGAFTVTKLQVCLELMFSLCASLLFFYLFQSELLYNLWWVVFENIMEHIRVWSLLKYLGFGCYYDWLWLYRIGSRQGWSESVGIKALGPTTLWVPA